MLLMLRYMQLRKPRVAKNLFCGLKTAMIHLPEMPERNFPEAKNNV